jgi:hypothetical protein
VTPTMITSFTLGSLGARASGSSCPTSSRARLNSPSPSMASSSSAASAREATTSAIHPPARCDLSPTAEHQ